MTAAQALLIVALLIVATIVFFPAYGFGLILFFALTLVSPFAVVWLAKKVAEWLKRRH